MPVAARMWLQRRRPGEVVQGRALTAGVPEFEVAAGDWDMVISVMRRKASLDVALAAIKVLANAVPRTRSMGVLGAPHFPGGGRGEGSRAHFLRCLELQQRLAAAEISTTSGTVAHRCWGRFPGPRGVAPMDG